MEEVIQQEQQQPEQPSMLGRITEEREAAQRFSQHLREPAEPEGDEPVDESAEQTVYESDDLPAETADEYSPETMLRFAESLGLGEDDLQNPRIAALVRGNIDAAIQAQQAETEGDPAEQQEQVESEQSQRQPQNEQEQFAQHLQSLQHIASDPRVNHPMMVQAFENSLMDAFQADTPEEKQNVQYLSRVLNEAGVGLISTLAPQIVEAQLTQILDRIAPGLLSQYQDATLTNTWSAACKEVGVELPAFGTPEFNDLAEKVSQDHPWLATMDFKDENGQPLPMMEALRAKAVLTARLLNGERVSPKSLQESYERGRESAKAKTRRVTAAKSLGSGRGSSGFTDSPREEESSVLRGYHEHLSRSGAFGRR